MTDARTTLNINGLETTSIAMIVRYAGRKYAVEIDEAFDALKRIRTLLRDGVSDVVPLAHSKGLVWLTIGPGVEISFTEVDAEKSQSAGAARKKLGLVD
jgi:hypothetical protein